MGKRFAPLSAIAAAVLLVATMFSVVSGQDAAGTPDAEGVALHPAHIHGGTCDEIGDVVFPLNDLQAASIVATPGDTSATPDSEMAMGSEDTERVVVAESGTVVEASLEDILAEEHVINVHESPENISNYIACGELTGEPEDGQLTIELIELNDSGFIGEAMLTDMGDGTTTVHVSLYPAEAPAGTPVATPSA